MNPKQGTSKADQWYTFKPVDPRVSPERAQYLKNLGYWSRNDACYDFSAFPEELYANDRDFFYMHPINGWLSKLVDDKRFIPILFRTASHLVPDLSIGIEDGMPKFILRCGCSEPAAPTLTGVFERYAKEFKALFLKPAGLSGGRGAFRFSPDTCQEAAESIDPRHAYLVSNALSNEAYAEDINPHSINTIRAYFFRPAGKDLRLFRAIHRFGTKASAPVDNLSSGGVACEIDLEAGRLSKVFAPSHEPVRCTAHPETGVLLEGFIIPDWNKKIGEIREMLDCLFFLEFGALDIAATPEGLKLLEVNTRPERRMLQMNRPAFLDREFAEFCRMKGYRSNWPLPGSAK
jgi:hypothetical protein